MENADKQYLWTEYQKDPPVLVLAGTNNDVFEYAIRHTGFSYSGMFIYGWFTLRNADGDKLDPTKGTIIPGKGGPQYKITPEVLQSLADRQENARRERREFVNRMTEQANKPTEAV